MIKKKLNFILLFLSVALFCYTQAPENWYNNKPIVGLSFKGLRTVSSSELDEIFKVYKKRLFSDEIYLEVLQKIYGLDYFISITPKAMPADEKYETVILEFEVIEKPSIKTISFKGNSKIKKSALQSAITLKTGNIYNEEDFQAAIRAIKIHYGEKGFPLAKVSGDVKNDEPSNSVIIEFKIEEGKMASISTISFEGNTMFPDKALKKILASKEAGFIQTGAFREELLQEDKNAIRLFYGEKGCIDAHVETIKKEIDTTSDSQKEQISLTYVILEGEQYKYSGTTFDGNHIFQASELAAKIKLKEGAIFNLKKFEQGFNDIANLYFENGYTSTYIDRREIRNEASREVGYLITIIERERSHIERIILSGNKKTKDNVILRELLFKEGDVFSKTKFVNSLRNLLNLRYFSNVIPDVKQGSELDLVDVIVNVEEQSTANVQFGMTFSGISDANSFPLSIFAQWEEKNLLGTGRELSANAKAGIDTQSLILGFTENWFLGSPVSVGFNFSITHKQLFTGQDVMYPIGVKDPDGYGMKYDRLEFGFGINSGYRWFPSFATITLRGSIDFGVVKNFYNDKLYRPFDQSIRNEQMKWGLSNSLWTRLSIDNRDIAHDPSKGWFVSQQFTFFGIFPKVENEYYFQAETIGEAYFTLLDYPVSDVWNLKFVLAFSSAFAFQLPTSKLPIPSDNRLRIDGMFKGRGWFAAGEDGYGSVMQNNWIEFRWPLAHGILSFDFFFDAIAVKPELKDLKTLKIDDYYFSFGPGLRFSIPQFPLRLMFANTFKSPNWKPVWGNGKNADWRFVISFNIVNQ